MLCMKSVAFRSVLCKAKHDRQIESVLEPRAINAHNIHRQIKP